MPMSSYYEVKSNNFGNFNLDTKLPTVIIKASPLVLDLILHIKHRSS